MIRHRKPAMPHMAQKVTKALLFVAGLEITFLAIVAISAFGHPR